MESVRGQHDQAREEMRSVINIWLQERGLDDKYTIWAFHMLAEANLRAARLETAESVWREALGMMLTRKELGRSTEQLPEIVSRLSKILDSQGDAAGAETVRKLLESG